MSTIRISPDRPSYTERREIRRVALQMATKIEARFPDVQVSVDLEMVDGEDAFVWIRIPHGADPAGLERTVERLARDQVRATDFWIVPRIVRQSTDSGPVFRLRPHLFEQPRPLLL